MSEGIRDEFKAWALRKGYAYRDLAGFWFYPAWGSGDGLFQGYIGGRQSALEEAAKVCEDIGDEYDRREGGKWPELKSDAKTGAGACEAAIRALASTEPSAGKTQGEQGC